MKSASSPAFETFQDVQQFRLPDDTKRTAIIGRTGSGKTQFGVWLLSLAPFDRMPYVLLDYKGDDLLNATDRIREIGTNEIPKQPGLYRLSPTMQENEDVETWLWNIWKKERIGLYVDEGYMIPDKSGAFNAILTQGRSKRIPAIVLTQRPSWISRFVFSEADFYVIFHLNERQDRKRVQEFIPREKIDIEERLPDYHSYWYDVGRDTAFRLAPVAAASELVETIHNRLKPKRRML